MNQHLSDSRGEPVIIFLHFPLSPCAPNLAGHLSTLATQYGVVLSHQQKTDVKHVSLFIFLYPPFAYVQLSKPKLYSRESLGTLSLTLQRLIKTEDMDKYQQE